MQRFLRLHRPFLIKSIESEDREYRLSYETCVDFSKAIIRNHKYVLERYAMTGMFISIYLNKVRKRICSRRSCRPRFRPHLLAPSIRRNHPLHHWIIETQHEGGNVARDTRIGRGVYRRCET